MIDRNDVDGITTLRLAHGKASALDIELLEGLDRSLSEIERSDIRAVVVMGTGSIFSAGVDLFRLIGEGRPYVEHFFPLLARSIRKFFLFPRPIVAAANGHAIAGGCILVASSDYRLMAAGKGRIGVPELVVGVPFPAVILEIMRFATAPQHLQRVLYTGGTFLPEEALEAGLIDEIAEPAALESRAMAIAQQLGSLRPDPFRITKMQLRGEVVQRAARFDDEAALEQWLSPKTHAHIREYLERTVGKSRHEP
ncbi:MAG: enoyl-CoA hydratase/isomerase family protein [Acidobacteriota bacterium]